MSVGESEDTVVVDTSEYARDTSEYARVLLARSESRTGGCHRLGEVMEQA